VVKKIIVLNLISLVLFGETVREKIDQAKINPSDFSRSAVELLERKSTATTRELLELFYDKVSNADSVMGLQASSEISKLMMKKGSFSNIKLEQILLAALENAKAEKSTTLDVKHVLQALSLEPEVKAVYTKHGVKQQTFAVGEQTTSTSGETKAATSDYTRELIALPKYQNADIPLGRDGEYDDLVRLVIDGKNVALIGDANSGRESLVYKLAMQMKNDGISSTLKKRILTVDVNKFLEGSEHRGKVGEKFSAFVKSMSEQKDVILYLKNLEAIDQGKVDGEQGLGELLCKEMEEAKLQFIARVSYEGFQKLKAKHSNLFSEDGFREIHLKKMDSKQWKQILTQKKVQWERRYKVVIDAKAIETVISLSDRYGTNPIMIMENALTGKAVSLLSYSSRYREVKDLLQKAEIALSQAKKNELAANIIQQYEELVVAARKAVEETEAINHSLEKENEKLASYQKQVEEMRFLIKKYETLQDAANLEATKAKLAALDGEIVTFIKAQSDIFKNQRLVEENDVAKEIGLLKKIPNPLKVGEDENQKLQNLEPNIKQYLTGQDYAIEQIVRGVQQKRFGWGDEDRPLVFFLAGPTGTGKTETGIQLSRFLFGEETPVKVIDMSQYEQKHNSSKLIGTPPGFQGMEDEGELTGSIRKNPYSVVILDEFDRADRALDNLFYKLFDTGMTTDAMGREVDGRNIIFLLTSNIGQDLIASATEEELKSPEFYEVLLKLLKERFEDATIGRFGKIISYNKHSEKSLSAVFDIKFKKVIKKAKTQGIEIMGIDPELKSIMVSELAKVQPSLGARPIDKKYMEDIKGHIMDGVVAGKIKPGDKIEVAFDKEAADPCKGIYIKIIK
jgi:ATP-dependent Clp protease ATP-binding subunit ClpB